MAHIGTRLVRSLKKWLEFGLDPQDRNKILWLMLAFACVIGSYTVLKEMKDVLFAQIVGSKYLYKVKFLSMFVLLPATLLYAKLVDRLNRLSLLMFYSILYGVAGCVIAYFLQDPVIGLANGTPSPDRYFGWFVYLFYEGVVPFVVSVFWSFANSVTSPETAKKGYPLLIAGSKIGGMLTAGFAWALFTPTTFLGQLGWSSVFMHQFLLVGASLMLIVSPFIIQMLINTTSQKNLHGYEAVYKYEQKQQEAGKSDTGILSGLIMMFKYPYIMGIFGMMFFYELINVVLGIQRTMILQAAAKDAAAFSGEMFWQRLMIHAAGLVLSFFGTRMLINRFGERICLLLIPLITGGLLTYFMMAYNEQAVLVVFMAMGVINYAFSSPLREALYIPTVKDMRFKSKAWIESFGQRFAKACSSGVIGTIQSIAVIGSPMYLSLFSAFFAIVVTLWTMVAFVLGRKYDRVIKKGEVIGVE